MRVLLDTHVLLWWLSGEEALSAAARSAIADADNETFVSAASAWEISIKYKQGRLPTAANFVADLDEAIARHGFSAVPITVHHGNRAGALPLHHKDPFDRMLIAQALAESLTLVSNERLFDNYGVARLW
jgi:PIN domain nuclease of toxin-antitoxin system